MCYLAEVLISCYEVCFENEKEMNVKADHKRVLLFCLMFLFQILVRICISMKIGFELHDVTVKTHLSLLSTGSTQEDLSRHN